MPILAACGAVLILSGCGDEASPLTYDTVITETTQAPAAAPVVPTTRPAPPTVPSDGPAEEWVDAAGSLVGLESECGNLTYVAARPDRPGIVTGVALNGLWESDDSGTTWANLGDGPESDEVTLRLTDLEWDPEDPETFWISGLYNGGGVYVSTDGGETMQRLGSIVSAENISVDLTDPERQTLVAPIHDVIDIYRSRDGGETWEDITEGLPDEGGAATAALVIDADTYLYGIRGGRLPGIFRTTDGGSSWERAYAASVTGEPLRTSDGRIYWMREGGTGLLTSEDDGLTWTEIPSTSISPDAPALLELPDGRLVTISDSTLIISEDRGLSWAGFGPALPYTPTGLTYAPNEGAFYIWRFDCAFSEDNPVRERTIVRLDVDLRSA